MPIRFDAARFNGLEKAIEHTLTGGRVQLGDKVGRRIAFYRDCVVSSAANEHAKLCATATADLAYSCISGSLKGPTEPIQNVSNAMNTVFCLFNPDTAEVFARMFTPDTTVPSLFFGKGKGDTFPAGIYSIAQSSIRASSTLSFGINLDFTRGVFRKDISGFRPYMADFSRVPFGVSETRFNELMTGPFGIVGLLADQFNDDAGGPNTGLQFLRAIAPLVFADHVLKLGWMEEMLRQGKS